jgi:hypothetical protein
VAVGKLGGLAKGGLKGAAGAIGGAAASAAVNAAAGIAQDAIGGAAQNIVGNIAGGGSQENTKRSKEGTYFVYSMRGEYVMMSEVKGIGGCIELGRIGKGGFYNTSQFSGGFKYWDYEQNLGACLNKDGVKGNYRSIIGASIGIRVVFTEKFYYEGNEHTLGHTGFGGVFYKLLFGDKNNFDITNKFMFGLLMNKYHADYYSIEGMYSPATVNLTYVLSVGYTLTKKR